LYRKEKKGARRLAISPPWRRREEKGGQEIFSSVHETRDGSAQAKWEGKRKGERESKRRKEPSQSSWDKKTVKGGTVVGPRKRM